jgi:benzylsuccinate CoA-transferase BbsF subunit
MSDRAILHNIRILDFTWALAGPYATRLLGDFGAEVIKVQPLLSSEANDAISQGYYNTWNRNKLGITLNMEKPEGITLAKRLVEICDAVVENFTPRVMANWGLDYDNLKKIKSDIIMVSLSVMGQADEHRDYVGFGPTVHALSGMTRLTSFPDRPPIGPGFSYADHVAGLYASIALLGALEKRRRTGRGQHIDISEVDVMKGLLNEATAEPMGNDSLKAIPHNVYRCKGKDRWCAISVSTDEEWRGLKEALGNPAWGDEKRFDTLTGRLENRQELNELISSWTQQYNVEEVMALLQENGVAAGVVQDADDLVKDPQLKERGFFIKDTRMTLVDATPIKLSESPAEYKRGAPLPGQDNEYVYGELLGISSGEMVGLKEKGVI